MPKNPHWYTLRKTWARDQDFVWAVEQIRLLGQRETFEGYWYTQLAVGSYTYWTMGWPIGELGWGWDRLNRAGTILIKQEAIEGTDLDLPGLSPTVTPR